MAPTKFVAKLGSTRAKPDGLLVVPGRPGAASSCTRCRSSALWGVGERAAETLRRLGLTHGRRPGRTRRSACCARALGEAAAAHLHELAWGRDPRRVDPRAGGEVDRRRDHLRRRRAPIREVIRRALLALADKVGRAAARAPARSGRTVSIKVRLADFRTVSRSRTLDVPTDVAREIFDTAWALFTALRARASRIRLVGVRVEGLAAADDAPRQLTLGEPERGWREAEAAADAAAARFGRSVVGPASLLGGDKRRIRAREKITRGRTVVPLSDPPTPS